MTDHSVLVKIGGSTLGAEDTTLADIVALQREGVPVVVVHGGGPAVTAWMDRQGLRAQFVRGLRVTDEASLEIVVAVLAGLVNKQLVAEVNARGGRAAGMSGADGPTLLAEVTDPTYGRVGQVREVRTEVLRALLDGGMVPFLSPVGLDVAAERPDAALLNINADTVAGEVAAALGVGRLVFLTDVAGVKGASGEFVAALSADECRALIEAGAIGGGMIPKVEACLRAAEAGATSLIVDGRQPGALRAALQGTTQGTKVG
jgi:acetylglutamate kinase